MFGHYVDDLNSFLATGEIQRPVVILQLAKVKPFQGILYLKQLLVAYYLLLLITYITYYLSLIIAYLLWL